MKVKLDKWQIEWLNKVSDKNICITSHGRRLGKSWLNSMIREYLEKIGDEYKCKGCGHFIHLLEDESCETCGYEK